MNKVLFKGSEAIAEAAIRAGCRYYFGYPITPQTEISEYFAEHLPKADGTFLQAESEIAAINMVYGAAGTGVRVMTSSSGPGMSLKQEGISYIACAEVPCVIASIMRGGPGLGGIQGAQADYHQTVRGGGHGDYKNIVLVPWNVQEAADLTYLAFDLADKYRSHVFVLGDGILGQMMEPILLPNEKREFEAKEWAIDTNPNRKRNTISSSYPKVEDLEKVIERLDKKYKEMEKEVRWDSFMTDDAEVLVVAYGISARIAKAAVRLARESGIKAGLFRPITVWPFPYEMLNQCSKNVKAVLNFEMSTGQMIDDVKLSFERNMKIEHFGRYGGVIPEVGEVFGKIKELAGGCENESSL